MNHTVDPLVSVVTPVYNAEKYLAECIESILAQTYQNWQYVIVNNYSTDRSLEIAQKYARQDPRIRVHDNDTFLNQMPNWNHAMRQISPESQYCKVVHADDWLFPECLRQMVALAEAHPTVGIVGAYRLDEDKVNLDGLPYPSPVVSGRELCRSYFLGGLLVFGSPTSLLIRSDLVRARETYYNEASVHADTEVCFDLLQISDFGFVHQVLTFTRRHNESITSVNHHLRTGSHRIGRFVILKKYGPVYLSPAEYEEHLQKRLKYYHRYLARSVFQRKGKAVWDYHRAEMEKLGYSIRPGALIGGVGLQLLSFKETLDMFRRSLREKKDQAS